MPQASPSAAWRDGWRRVAAAPLVAAGALAFTVLLAAPLALSMAGLIEAHLDRSALADTVAAGADYDWWQEFIAQARGLGTTFAPTIVGFAATLDNVSGLLDGQRRIVPIAAAIAAYLAGWTFLAGGILDRYARQRPARAHGFFSACGVYFFRFLRLAAVAGAVYWWLFAYVREWLFEEWLVDLTRNVSVERVAFAWRLAFYALFGSLLVLLNVVFDYAKVRLVVEDRRSVVGALAGALRFVGHNAAAVAGLYAANAAVFVGLIAAWAAAAPGASWPVWAAVAVGQTYVLARLLLKLQFLASQVSLFQSRLAHAAFTRAPEPVWPESPAAETIARA